MQLEGHATTKLSSNYPLLCSVTKLLADTVFTHPIPRGLDNNKFLLHFNIQSGMGKWFFPAFD